MQFDIGDIVTVSDGYYWQRTSKSWVCYKPSGEVYTSHSLDSNQDKILDDLVTGKQYNCKLIRVIDSSIRRMFKQWTS